METPTNQITFTLTTDDLDDAKRYGDQIEKRESKISGNAVAIGLVMLFVAAVSVGFYRAANRGGLTPALLVQLLPPVLVLLLAPFALRLVRSQSRRALHRQSGEFFAPRTAILSEDGYREVWQNSEFFHGWANITEIADTEKHIFLILCPTGQQKTAYFIPNRAFASPDAATAFGERARAFRRAVRARSVTP